MVPGIDRELVVSDCEVPTPELSLITSEAVSPRLLSKKKFTEQGWSVEISPFYRAPFHSGERHANAIYIYIYILLTGYKHKMGLSFLAQTVSAFLSFLFCKIAQINIYVVERVGWNVQVMVH